MQTSINHEFLRTGSFALVILSASVLTSAPSRAEDVPDYYRDIRPVLSKNCFHCHGPDEETRESGLRLDHPDGLFGNADRDGVILRGDASKSQMILRILSDDDSLRMPPADSGRSLTETQKQLLIRWVDSGADWREHWAFVPPRLPALPEVTMPADASAVPFTEIDAFLEVKRRSAGLNASAAADPEILVRRVFLDLIGLPPTVEEADYWVGQLRGPDRNQSWRNLADNLMARPEYGERWARPWLDLARYADTNGYEKDRPRSIWPWRDWVIDALNTDMPFDQFTIEQLAGDLLPSPTTSQLIATGFHRNTMLNEEGGIDPLEFRFHAMTDRVATTGTTWLGLTVGCAQCHSHKYDPLTHREYYGMMAFLNNCDEPSLHLPAHDAESQAEHTRQTAEQLMQNLETQWPTETFSSAVSEIVRVMSTGGESISHTDGLIQVKGPIAGRTDYVIDLEVKDLSRLEQVQLEGVTLKGRRGPGRSENGNFVLSELELSLIDRTSESQPETETRLEIVAVQANAEQSGFEASQSIDGDLTTGWAVDTGNGVAAAPILTATLNSEQLQKQPGAGEKDSHLLLRIRLRQNYGAAHTLQALRIKAGRLRNTEELNHERTQAVDQNFARWLDEQRRFMVEWSPLKPLTLKSNLPYLRVLDDDSVLATGDTTKQDHYEIILSPASEPLTALRLEALPDERLPGNGPGTTYYEGSLGDFYLNEFTVFADDQPVRFASASESYAKNRFGNSPTSAALTLDGDVQTGWSVADAEGQRHTAVYIPEKPIPPDVSIRVQMTFGRHFASSLGRFRLSGTSSPAQPAANRLSDADERLLLRPPETLSDDERRQLRRTFLMNSDELRSDAERIRKLLTTQTGISTLVMRERPPENPRPTFRHHRGEYLDPREPVAPGTPAFLHSWPAEFPQNRLGFAQWLVHRDNPLTARVVVNRHWAAFFGNGIVSTPDDFGVQGTPPTHSELLDWLAVTWMDEDRWSVRALHRRLVLSAAYQQSSVRDKLAAQIDPENRLLSAAPRYRLDAEVIRDCILKAAGVLSSKQGGPPVKPVQPPGITEVTFGSPRWDVSSGEDRYRRSIYTFIKRTAPFAMVSTFDGPSGEFCTARRNRSNTPLQALTLLNDPMFIDLAREAGKSLAAMSATDEQRITRMFRRLVTRMPDTDEIRSIRKFLEQSRQSFREDLNSARQLLDIPKTDMPDSEPYEFDIAEAAAWTAVSRALFALDEVVMRP